MNSPLASLGRYFFFCSTVPYQTIGKVPMPTCAVKATEKLPCLAMLSAMMADVTLSISRPPYSSGISTEVRPRSLASLMRRRVTEKSLASIWSETGMISLVAKSAVVCAIWRCSSVKSSGKKQSAGVASAIRKLPPGMRFVIGTGVVVIVAIAFHLNRVLRNCFQSQSSVHTFKYPGGSHASANAHRDHAVLRLAPRHLVQQRGGELSSSAAERMPKRDGSSVDIELCGVDAKNFDDSKRLSSKGLVQLNHIDLIEAQASQLQSFGNSVDRTDAHLLGVATRVGERDEL